MNKKAFTKIEIISFFFIILIIIIIVLSYFGAKKQNVENSKKTIELEKLENNIENYISKNNSLPEIIGNKNYFDEKGDYEENINSAFGVHGFLKNNYAYGKTTDNNFYQIATIVNIDGEYITKVVGNYNGNKKLIGLIREYNGPSFVFNNSKSIFPYNPTKKNITAKINNFSGKIIINTKNGKKITEKNNILKYILEEGDSIKTNFSSNATIFFSDGSISVLRENSKLVLENMQFYKKNNLFTKIRLFLESGTIWTKATKIGEKSNFEVNTQDTVAAVRGTIFAVKYRNNQTSTTVKKGYVKLKNNNSEKILKSGEFTGKKIEFKKFEIIKPDIIYNPVNGELINNLVK